MRLSEILKQEFDPAYRDIEIKGVTCDSRTVRENYAFVCIDGTSTDGHKFALSAEENGACIIIAEHDTGAKNQIIVENTRQTYALMCAAYFGNPAQKLRLVGVTGTNGKTSTTYMVKEILERCGHKVGLIGTIQNIIGDEILTAKNTTPDAFELHSLFSLMLKAGCDFVVMEVSSHALEQYRVWGLQFETAVFTNLTQDHLDYHKTMERYVESKKKLFSMCKNAVVNFDDPYRETMLEGFDGNVISYSAKSDFSTYTAKNLRYRADGVDFELVGNGVIGRVRLDVPGEFSAYNAMAAVCVAISAGVDFDTAVPMLKYVKGVKGRAEVVPTNTDYTVIIDYAHTPDGLKNILDTLRRVEKARVITVFGCGGDRDRLKRPLMGEIAARFSGYCIVTSDNPRTEQPMAIIEDIVAGMKAYRTPYKVIENRVEAIRYALGMAQPGDIVLLAGKGHETYQITAQGTIHLDEREVVASFFEA